ncbi:MAG: hypothetical protein HND54_06600 [Bacteroidetes bacterium]|nr:hypothetical protein [Flavobacteriales bacterium]NOG57386.1 hypothetical protein [Bacteroidota bacterium]
MSIKASAQDVYPLHPSIGDTLHAIDKLDYSLFPDISNSDFQFGTISFENDTFYLNANYINQFQKFALSKESIIEAQQNIEKVNAYYRLKAKEDLESTQKAENYYGDKPSGKTPVFLNEAMNDQIKKEARMFLRIQEDAQRLRDHQNGIRPNEIRIQFK